MPGHRYSVPVYLGAGVISTASHYVVTLVGVELLAMPAVAASAAGFLAGAAVKYVLNYFVAFRSGERHSAAVARFAATLAVLFALNAVFFTLLHHAAGLHYMVAQVLTTGLLVPPGYLLSRLWVFRPC